jgi:hypothetical protein
MKNAIIAVLATLVTVVSQGQNLAREQVVKGGNTPYHRYDVPEGKLDVAPLSIFTQPPYEKNKKVVDAMPRGRAEDLGFTGELVYNEYPDRAPKVKLAATSVLIYEETPQGKVPRYLADCQRNGKPYANRIALVDTSRFQAKPQTREVFQTQPTNVTVNNPPTTNTVNMPAIPGTFNVNVAGLPQYPQPATYPAYPTYHVINESIVHRDWAAKFKDVGIGGGVLLAGAAAETGSILIPRAITKSAQIKADASKDVANIQAAAAKYTAEQQVLAAGALKPATYTISATAPATMNGGVQTLSPQITTTTTSTANPKVDVSPTIAPTVSTVATAAPF